ncbi:MAG: hypothetical protein AAFV33_24510, partial [Chloroflexota bacterium]
DAYSPDSFNKAHPFPTYDEWQLSQYIAVRAASSTLTFSDLMVKYGVHRPVPSNFLTALSVWLTDWHIPTVMLFNPILAILNFIVLARFSWNISSTWSPIFIFGAAVFVFAPGQLETWLIPIHSSWLFAALFVSLAAYVVAFFPLTRRSIALLIGLAVLATFSIGTVIILWGIILGAFVLKGIRDWRVYLIFAGTGVLVTGLYVSEYAGVIQSQIDLFPSYTAASVHVQPGVFVEETLNSIGGNLLPIRSRATALIGFVMMGIVITLMAWLWRENTLRSLLVGIAVLAMYGLFGTAFIMLGRAAEVRASGILYLRYEVTSMYVFLSLLLLIVIALEHSFLERRSVRLVAVAGVTILASADIFFESARLMAGLSYYGNLYSVFPCVMQYPVTRDTDCPHDVITTHRQPEFILQNAAYGLTGFRNQSAPVLLTQSATQGSQVIVVSPSIWLNLYVREQMLDSMLESQLIHIAPAPRWTDAGLFPDPPTDWLDRCDPDELEPLITGQSDIWIVVAAESVGSDI